MKIDDIPKDSRLKPDKALREKVGVSGAKSSVPDELPDKQALSVDTGHFDLLQAFHGSVAMRRQLMEQLPAKVKQQIAEIMHTAVEPEQQTASSPIKTRLESAGQTTSQQSRPSIAQGSAAMLKAARNVMNTLRHIANEMDSISRLTDFDKNFASLFADADNRATPGQSLGQLQGSTLQLKNQTSVVQVPAAAVDSNPAAVKFSSARLQQAVDMALTSFHSAKSAETPAKIGWPPAAALAALVSKDIAAGSVGEELNRWITVADVVIGKQAGVQEATAGLIAKLDPQLIRLAETSGKPELLRVWVAVEELATQTEGSLASAGTTPSILQFMSKGNQEALSILLQNLAAGAGAEAAGPSGSALASAAVSRVSQFEMLVTSLSQPGGDMTRLLAELPAVLAGMETMLPSKESSRNVANLYEKLTRSAPRWLRNLSQQANSADLASFWVAAKVADMSPWFQLTTEERQRSSELLKSLAATYDQPEAFRAATDDGGAKCLTFQMALYAPGQEKPYPALIQVFAEKRERGPGQLPEQEAWVRISIETDYLGPVDLSFRLQDKTQLSIFTRFVRQESAEEFREYLPEIRAELADTKLQLKKIAVTDRTSVKGA